MSIDAYLESKADLARDMAFCSINRDVAARIRAAADGILRDGRMLFDLKLIDEAFDSNDCAARVGKLCSDEYPQPETEAGAFLLAFPILHRVQRLRAFYAEHSIPEEYASALMTDLPRWIETFSDWNPCRHGFSQVFWLREHVLGHIFQIGRLQFQPGSWYVQFEALSNSCGETVLVAHSGDKVARCGLYASAKGVDGDGAFEVGFAEDEQGITGHRVIRGGRLASSPEFFPAGEWRRIATAGDPVLNIHIPSGSPLTPAECARSVAEAPVFFRRHFPEMPEPRAMLCESWLLTAGFDALLPPDSNILAFQRMFTLFPMRGASGAQMYERAFNCQPPTQANARTSLQKAILEHVAAGATLVEGGGAILPPNPCFS